MDCAGKRSTGKRKHRPADADTHQEKEKERPENVFDAVFGATAAKEAEGNGNYHGEEKKGLEVREFERGNGRRRGKRPRHRFRWPGRRGRSCQCRGRRYSQECQKHRFPGG